MEVNNRNYIVSHINSASASRRDICLKRYLVEEGFSFKWRIFLIIEVPTKNSLLSKYEREWRSIAGSVLFPKKKHPPPHGGILSAYHDGNPLTILWIFFLLLLLHVIPWRGNQICYYNNINFQKIIKNLRKVSRIMLGHYNCPLRNISTFVILFNVWVKIRKFW